LEDEWMTGYSDAMQDSFFCPQRYPYKQWQPSASMIFYMFQLSETMERSSIKLGRLARYARL